MEFRKYPPSKPRLSPEEWMSVLKLSTVWEFDAIRTTAIDELDEYGKCDPILRIIVAKRFNIPQWFLPAVNHFAQRTEAPDDHDLERLLSIGSPSGVFKFLLKVGQLRETLDREPVSTNSTTINESCVWDDAKDDLGEYFCETHGAYFRTCPMAGSSSTQRHTLMPRRSQHDFTTEAARIFNCVRDNSGHFMPQESSWDLT